ncbi:hypothetical protein RI845_15045 [Thalassotalea nanhaiensis]|uniref:Uncharacterized protein n=1 Tax=Thalassotalea nanhaiensis TaxID=3065648 RepID=A0ABY9TGB4_9GAMM|nr:hypothetical protein RI845_15045 [Colwelliaceae bacterium SQ345]
MDINNKQMKSDARIASYIFIALNITMVLFFFAEGTTSVFGIVILFVQFLLIVFWLFPVFCYQLFVNKMDRKLALYKALASYKEAMSHVSW